MGCSVGRHWFVLCSMSRDSTDHVGPVIVLPIDFKYHRDSEFDSPREPCTLDKLLESVCPPVPPGGAGTCRMKGVGGVPVWPWSIRTQQWQPVWSPGTLQVDFRPLPFLGNAHLQTLIGNLWTGSLPALATREHLVDLADGDRLVLHDSTPPGWKGGGRIALLVHGLAGTHQSSYLMRLAAYLLPRGFRIVRMDLRGCGRGIGLARRGYNGGCSDDVRAAALEIQRW